MSGREQDKNNYATLNHSEPGSWLQCRNVCVYVSVCLACIELSAVLCGMRVQCASAVSSCCTVELQTRGESEGKRNDSWGEDEDRDRVRCSARQRRLQILVFCLLLQAVRSYRPVSIVCLYTPVSVCERKRDRNVCMMLEC